jgi:hypothetical protein
MKKLFYLYYHFMVALNFYQAFKLIFGYQIQKRHILNHLPRKCFNMLAFFIHVQNIHKQLEFKYKIFNHVTNEII